MGKKMNNILVRQNLDNIFILNWRNSEIFIMSFSQLGKHFLLSNIQKIPKHTTPESCNVNEAEIQGHW